MTNKLSKAVLYSSISLLGLGLAGAASAYQFEAGVGYAQGDIEDVDLDTVGAGGTFYFGDVSTGNGPLAEAAFLSRASGVSLGYSSSEVDDFNLDLDSLEGSARFVSMDTGWLATVGYVSQELDDSYDKLDIDRLSIGVGRYFGENNTVTLQYSDIEADFNGYGTADGDSISLNFRGVAVGQVTHVFEASVISSEIEDEDATGFMAGWTVYPSMDIGVGISYAKDAAGTSAFESVGFAGDLDSQILTLHGSWFITDSIAIGLCYSDIEVADVDGDQIGLIAGLRF